MKILYRISDSSNKKLRPDYVNNKHKMFLHFISIFKNHDIYIFADNVSDETFNFILNSAGHYKLIRTYLGNSESFMFSVNYAINNFNNNDIIYFAEDDYVYKKEAPKIIEEGLKLADYSSGYDHPDKYLNHSQGGPNPFIEEGGELSRVLLTDSSHWKFTNSCCMTFATTLKTLKDDFDIFENNCTGKDPYDFWIFFDLYKIKNKKLSSCIPSVSTHGETEWLAKLIDWEKVFNDSFTN
jgi:hypothetical protein